MLHFLWPPSIHERHDGKTSAATSLTLTFAVLQLDEMPNEMDAIQDALLELTGGEAYPVIRLHALTNPHVHALANLPSAMHVLMRRLPEHMRGIS